MLEEIEKSKKVIDATSSSSSPERTATGKLSCNVDVGDVLAEIEKSKKVIDSPVPGSRIQIYWPLDQKFYDCTVVSNITSTCTRVDYDDGEEEVVDLMEVKERWKYIYDEARSECCQLGSNFYRYVYLR